LKKLYQTLVLAVGTLFSITVSAQNVGQPFVRNYTPIDIGGSSTTWDVVCDSRGVLYAANYSNIAIYNGDAWIGVDVGNTYVYSLNISNRDEIFTGGTGDIGKLIVDSLGTYKLKSLAHLIPEKYKRFGQVWKTYHQGKSMIFIANENIFQYINNTIRVISNPNNKAEFLHSTSFKENVYVSSSDDKFYKLTDGKLKLIIAKFKYGKPSRFFTDESGIYIMNRKHEIYKFSFKTSKLDRICQLEGVGDLSENDIYTLEQFNDGSIGLGTYNNGLILFDCNGKQIRSFTKENSGIVQNGIRRISKDYENNLWIGTDEGLSHVKYYHPITWFNSEIDEIGAVYDVNRIHGTLYLCSRNGLYQLINGKTYKLEGIPTPVVNIAPFDFKKESFEIIATFNGLFEKNGTIIKGLSALDSYTSVIQHPKFKDYILTTTTEGYVVKIQRKEGKWVNKGKINKGVLGKKLVIENDSTIWVRTGTDGVKKLVWFYNHIDSVKIYYYNTLNGLPTLKELYVNSGNGKTLFSTSDGIQVFNKKINKFEYYKGISLKDSVNFGFYITIPLKKNNVLAHCYSTQTNSRKTILLKTSGNSLKIDSIIYADLDELKVFSSFYEGNTAWLGGPSGVYKIDLNFKNKNVKPKAPLITKVTIGKDSIIHHYNFIEKIGESYKTCATQKDESIYSLKYSLRDVKFNFSLPSYINDKNNQFSYRLVGYDKEWSNWSTKKEKEYTNLGEKKYTFMVRGRNGIGVEGPTISYRFIILPPWYRTIYALVIYLLLISGFIYLLIRLNNKRLRADNIKLEGIVEERTMEVIKQKEEIMEQNEMINSSIRYAKTIQDAILTSNGFFESVFSQFFILYKPKDIVSGDFYWAYKSKSNKLFWVAADCTGHGVSGAFMTMIGNSLLNEIIIEQEEERTNVILDNLREQIIKTLNKDTDFNSKGKMQNGMDISLCCLDLNTNKLSFSGANNPLFVIRNKELIVIKGDPQPIGLHKKMTPFSIHELDMFTNDIVYTFSDGYHDQLREDDGERYKISNFKQKLLDIHELPLLDQKNELDVVFNNWKGSSSQVDDVLVMGVKVTLLSENFID